MQETPCTSIETPNESGHFEPLETIMAVTRVRFPSPAPCFTIINKIRHFISSNRREMVRLLTPTANTSTTVQARSRLVIAAEIGRSCGQAARLCWRRLTMPSLRSVRQCFRVRSTTKTIQEVSFFALTVPLGAHREGEIAVRVRFGFPSP